jgi:UDP-N-acetylglucosamine 2-epimerase (non-hydrolysing)
MKVLHVVGARPNFMKLAPVYKAVKTKKIKQLIVHTGQHYNTNMSEVFFKELNIPKPDFNLEVGSGSQVVQVAKIMISLEPIIIKNKPDLVILYGDVNSTVAAALVCSKLQTKIAHVEAGLRSFDETMPEEINRIITDRVSDIFFTTSIEANYNLKKEGVDQKKIHLVGNVMIDTLTQFINTYPKNPIKTTDEYAVVTIHRPSNVDNPKNLRIIIKKLTEISSYLDLYFSVHPRTKDRLSAILKDQNNNIHLLDPLGYIEFLNLIKKSKMVITDSGGIQEETTFLGIPCLTLRKNTERPVTISLGTNTLIGDDFNFLLKNVKDIMDGKYKKGKIPELWDGHAAERIAEIISKL